MTSPAALTFDVRSLGQTKVSGLRYRNHGGCRLGGRLCGVDRDGVVDVAVAICRAGCINAVVVDVGLLHDITCGAGLGATRGEIARWAGLIASQWIGNGDAGQGDVAGVFNRDGIV